MTHPRDVILDLLPLYMAGEASEATRKVVEDYLRDDPELAASVREGSALDMSSVSDVDVPRALEMRALKGTRRRIALLRSLFGLACFFSAISLGVELNRAHGHTTGSLLLVRYPSVMIYPVLVAVVSWAAYFWIRWKKGGFA